MSLHVIDENDLVDWLHEARLETYARSGQKRLMVDLTTGVFEVHYAGQRVYKGGDPKLAVQVYNEHPS